MASTITLMALNNVVKKIDQARSKVGLGPDEQVLGACITDPNSVAIAAAGGLAGVAIKAMLDGKNTTAIGEGMAAAWPRGRHMLGVTSTRVIVCEMSALSGKPTKLVAAWDHSDITSFVIEEAKVLYPFAITFSDGSVAASKAAKATGASELGPVLARIWA